LVVVCRVVLVFWFSLSALLFRPLLPSFSLSFFVLLLFLALFCPVCFFALWPYVLLLLPCFCMPFFLCLLHVRVPACLFLLSFASVVLCLCRILLFASLLHVASPTCLLSLLTFCSLLAFCPLLAFSGGLPGSSLPTGGFPKGRGMTVYISPPPYPALAGLGIVVVVVVVMGSFRNLAKLDYSSFNIGLKQILSENDISTRILRSTYPEAVEMVRATIIEYPQKLHAKLQTSLKKSNSNSMPMDYTLLQVVREYGDKIELTESDGKPRTSKKKGKRKSSNGFTVKERRVDYIDAWQGPAPWDSLLGGDGCPKFLCDVMCGPMDIPAVLVKMFVLGFKLHMGVDKAIKEKRVLLTRDAKLLRHENLLKNQIYRVKSLLKNDQLNEVIETFQLNICKDQLMSRCTKCNGRFIQKPLSIDEAIEAAKGFQVIPNCLFDRNIEFWQCTDCNQLLLGGTQYHNAVQKFIDVCKISSTA
ncbi:3'-5' exonuclease domain-containing protein, partial [Tanacetum coccineum]